MRRQRAGDRERSNVDQRLINHPLHEESKYSRNPKIKALRGRGSLITGLHQSERVQSQQETVGYGL